MLPIYDKVAAGGTAGLVATVIVGVLAAVHVTLPAAAVAAIVTLIMFGVSYVKTETKAGREIAKFVEAIENDGPVAKG